MQYHRTVEIRSTGKRPKKRAFTNSGRMYPKNRPFPFGAVFPSAVQCVPAWLGCDDFSTCLVKYLAVTACRDVSGGPDSEAWPTSVVRAKYEQFKEHGSLLACASAA